MSNVIEKRKVLDCNDDDNDEEMNRKTPFEDFQPKKKFHTQIINASMDCPNAKVNQVIGKKGSAIQAVMERSACKIQIDPNPSLDPRKVNITGSPEGISIAMSLITRIIDEGPTFLVPIAPESTTKFFVNIDDDTPVYCPHSKVAALIGSKGVVVGEIIKHTGCKVQVIQDGVPDGQDRVVSFSGNKSQIAEAKKLVLAVIKEGPSALQSFANPMSIYGPAVAVTCGAQMVERDILPHKVGAVIGVRGSTIADIMKRSGCKVYINQNFPEGQFHKVIYTGTLTQINAAVPLVEAVSEYGADALKYFPVSQPHIHAQGAVSSMMESSMTHEMTLYQSQVQTICGLQGAVLQDLQLRYRVQVSFEPMPSIPGLPGDPVNKVTIHGTPSCISGAVETMYQILGVQSDPFAGIGASYTFPAYQGGNSYTGTSAGNNNNNNSNQNGGGGNTTSMSTSFALGADGKAGLLESAVTLAEGLQQQIAEIKNESMSKVLGKGSVNLELIKIKSGCSLRVLGPGGDVNRQDTPGYTRLVILGAPDNVSIASQMIQEVLVNGTGKLEQMPDVPISVQSNVESYYSQQQQQQQQTNGATSQSYASNSSAGYADPRSTHALKISERYKS